MFEFCLGQVDFVKTVARCSVAVFVLTLLLILLLGLYMNLRNRRLLGKEGGSGTLNAGPESSGKMTAVCEILRKYVGNLETSEEGRD